PRQFANSEIWIIEAADLRDKVPTWLTPELESDKCAIQPDCVFAEIATLRAVGHPERLVGRRRSVGFTGADAQSHGKTILQIHQPTEASTDATALPILIDVRLGRVCRTGHIKRRTCVDRVEIGKRARVVISGREKVSFVTKSQVHKRAEPQHPGRKS